MMLFIIGFWLFPGEDEEDEYIFDKSYNISLNDVKTARTPLRLDNTAQSPSTEELRLNSPAPDTIQENDQQIDLKAIFSEGLINAHTTYKYFKHLEHKFRESTTLGEHFDQVQKYLFSEFSEKEAQELFDTYKKYLQCEMDLQEEFRNLSGVESMTEALETLKRIQTFRRDRLGVELADKLFGADVKAKEYAFRRGDIVGDEKLYGEEKQELLNKLNADMWGEEAGAVDEYEPDTPTAWQRFHEKQLIYKKDLEEIGSEEEKQVAIKAYRKDFFSTEAIIRLEEVDKQIETETQKEITYREKEQHILNDKKLSADEKDKQLQGIQKELFGDEAEAFQRRETMRIELERMMKEGESKKKK